MSALGRQKKKEKGGYLYISRSAQTCALGLSCSYPPLQNSFSFMRVATDEWFTVNKIEFAGKQWEKVFLEKNSAHDIQRSLGCGLEATCKASSSLELRLILEGTVKSHDLCLWEALLLVLKDLIQVWVMFSRQSGAIPGDSVRDISACFVLWVCV